MTRPSAADSQLIEALAELLASSKGMSVPHLVVHLTNRGVQATPLEVTRALRGSDRFRLHTPLGDLWVLRPDGDPAPPPVGAFRDDMPPLFTWQRRSLDAWIDHAHRGIVEAITGAGKSLVGVAAVRDAATEGIRSLVIVPTTPLVEQWRQALMRNLPGIRVATVGGGGVDHALPFADVTVSTVHSAVTRVPTPDVAARMLLVADEAHRYAASTFRPIVSAGFVRRLGLTATLQRRDGADETFLLPEIGPVVHTLSYRDALEEGVVAPFRVRLLGVEIGEADRDRYAVLLTRMEEIEAELGSLLPSSDGTGDGTGSTTVGAIRSLAGRGGRGSDLAKEYIRLLDTVLDLLDEAPEKMDALRGLAPQIGASKGCIIFTQTVQLAQAAALNLRAAGIDLAVLTSEQSHDERTAVLARFGSGHLTAIVAPQLLDEGIDVPDADLGIVVSSSRTRRQMVQRMGRVIRPKLDGRLATFVVIYGRDTREDPANGAHAVFLEEVLPLAQSVEVGPA